MFIFAVILLGSLDQLLADPRPCTKDDFCRTVPTGFCSDSLCKPFDPKQYAEFGKNGVKIITYNIASKSLIRYCPLTFPVDLSEGNNGMTTMTNIVSMNSGPDCDISTTTNITFSFKPDYNGLVTKMEQELAGDKYEACFTYFKPGVGYVFRSCRVDPPPAYGYGEECATYQVLLARGVCSDDLQKFLDDMKFDFVQEQVDCL